MTDSYSSDADTRRFDTLLDVYLAGIASPADVAELNSLYCARGGDSRRLHAVKRYWTIRPDDAALERDRQREALLRRIAVEKTGVASVGMWRGRIADVGTRTLRGWVWALGIVVLFIPALFVVRFGSSRALGMTRTYVTRANQQGMLTLVDGTHVILAPQTTLRLLGFSQQSRTVSVDGKVYFQVAHSGGAPFEVHAGAVTARVLGTAFLVDHAPHSRRVRVAVEEGKVRVSNAVRGDADMTISAGYVGEISDSTTTMVAVDDSASGTEWLHGKLVFYNAPVATVLQTLSRWYGYEFRCVDSTLARRNVTIGLSVRSSASAFATLEQILNVSLIMTGDTVLLTPHSVSRAKSTTRVQSYDIWTPTREVGR